MRKEYGIRMNMGQSSVDRLLSYSGTMVHSLCSGIELKAVQRVVVKSKIFICTENTH